MQDITGATCPACEAERSRPHFTFEAQHLLRCAECGTVYVHPLPTPEHSKALHTDAYDGAQTSYFAKVDKKMRRSRHRVRALAKYVKQGRRFLDIGCNGGFMVESAREAGFDGTGVDIDPISIAYAQKHYPRNQFYCGTVEDFATTHSGGFDLVYCSEVIEHLPDPRSFLQVTVKLLDPGGILCLTTPDISHWRVPRDLSTWDGFCPPVHCVYFTPQSLIRLIREFGLVLRRRRLAFKPGIKLICQKPR